MRRKFDLREGQSAISRRAPILQGFDARRDFECREPVEKTVSLPKDSRVTVLAELLSQERTWDILNLLLRPRAANGRKPFGA